MSTPLYDALTQFAAQNPLRMAMPGHKGKPIPGLPAEYARLDFTELPPTGNLYGEDMDCIAQAEQAWAEGSRTNGRVGGKKDPHGRSRWRVFWGCQYTVV